MTHNLTAKRLGLVLAVAVGVLLGAIFGQPGNGRAASTVVPKNTQLPTISGTAAVGATLTASVGKWANNPTSYSYRWKRCDSSGNACAVIANATAKIYTVTYADVSHTIRVTVKAVNSTGPAWASSAQTAVVPTSGCPAGTGTIQVADLNPPAQLEIGVGSITPAVVTRKTSSIVLSFGVTACGGRPVQGATLFATAIPYNQFAAASATTGSTGVATITEAQLSGFPAGRHQELLVILARATKPGQPLNGNVSSRRVVSFHASVK